MDLIRFSNKWSNIIIAISALLAAIATFLIWRVSLEQAKYTRLASEEAARPVIQIDDIVDIRGRYAARNNLGGIVGPGEDMPLILLTNIGKGSAHNLRIEERGDKIGEKKELHVGQTSEHPIPYEKIISKRSFFLVKVTYQDIFGNQFTVVEVVPNRSLP